MIRNKSMSGIFIFLLIFGAGTIPTELVAKKIKFTHNKKESKTNKSKKMKLMSSFITDTNNAKSARKISSTISQGQKIYFYYKVGPVKIIKGKGAPYKTRLVVKKGSKVLKDFGWHNANAVTKNQMSKNGTYDWFQTTGWNLTISKNFRPGDYTAVVTHRDQNSGKTINIRYKFRIKRGKR